MSSSTYRKLSALLIFTGACFAYILVSQGINHVFMPGLPLYQPPFGPLGNILLGILVGASVGLVLGWFETGGVSVLLASLLGALFMAIATLLSGKDDSVTQAHRLTATLIIFVPIAGALAPGLILFRWLTGREVMAYREAQKGHPNPPFQRYFWPVATLLVCAGFGITSLYPELGRSAAPRMQDLIQQGMRSQSAEKLPASFRSPDVNMFSEKAKGPYTLQWDPDKTNQFAIPRPVTNFAEQSTVIARFANGYILACMFPGKNSQPTCRDFENELLIPGAR